MKKAFAGILIGLFSTLAFSAGVAEQVWTVLGVNKEGTVISFDTANIIKHGKYVALWGKRDYSKPKNVVNIKGVVTAMDQIIFDCSDKRWGILTQIVLLKDSKKALTTIDIQPTETEKIQWDSYTDGSNLGVIGKQVCEIDDGVDRMKNLPKATGKKITV